VSLGALGGTVDGVLTTTTTVDTDDALVDQTVQSRPNVTGGVVRLETPIEMVGSDVRSGSLGAEAKQSVEHQVTTRLDASFLVDGDATVRSFFHAGVVCVVRTALRELHVTLSL